MRTVLGTSCIAILILVGCSRQLPQPVSQHYDPTTTITFDEFGFRSFAIVSSVTPKFPPNALIHRHFGAVVVKVDLDGHGKVKMVKVLQSPGPELSEAFLSALQDWKFAEGPKPDGQGPPLAYSGKLTYYFVLQNGRPTVLSGTDSFFASSA